MKTHPTKQKQDKTNPNSTATRECDQTRLDQVAEELSKLARNRLPNNVLRGVLSGYEGDLRQDAILLALSWYIRRESESTDCPQYPWHAPRAIAAALKIAKRDLLKALKRQAESIQGITEQGAAGACHPTQARTCDWPPGAMQSMIRQAISIALYEGRISHANAFVALAVFVDQTPAREMAKRLNVHRSAVYQHLSRVRREIPDIIDGLEVPMGELF